MANVKYRACEEYLSFMCNIDGRIHSFFCLYATSLFAAFRSCNHSLFRV